MLSDRLISAPKDSKSVQSHVLTQFLTIRSPSRVSTEIASIHTVEYGHYQRFKFTVDLNCDCECVVRETVDSEVVFLVCGFEHERFLGVMGQERSAVVDAEDAI